MEQRETSAVYLIVYNEMLNPVKRCLQRSSSPLFFLEKCQAVISLAAEFHVCALRRIIHISILL